MTAKKRSKLPRPFQRPHHHRKLKKAERELQEVRRHRQQGGKDVAGR